MMNRIFEIDGERYDVSPAVDGEISERGDGAFSFDADNSTHFVWMVRDGDRVFVRLNGRTYQIDEIDPRSMVADGGMAEDTAKAPMPGTVISVEAAPGREVRNGEVLLTIESMKLQTQITAWRDGVVEEIHLAEGDEFDRGAPLVSLKGEED